jgi:hypothetical protein
MHHASRVEAAANVLEREERKCLQVRIQEQVGAPVSHKPINSFSLSSIIAFSSFSWPHLSPTPQPPFDLWTATINPNRDGATLVYRSHLVFSSALVVTDFFLSFFFFDVFHTSSAAITRTYSPYWPLLSATQALSRDKPVYKEVSHYVLVKFSVSPSFSFLLCVSPSFDIRVTEVLSATAVNFVLSTRLSLARHSRSWNCSPQRPSVKLPCSPVLSLLSYTCLGQRQQGHSGRGGGTRRTLHPPTHLTSIGLVRV